MELIPLAQREHIELAAAWLSEERTYRWLDFGSGPQALNPVALKVMAQRDAHLLRLFTADEDPKPIGVVGLSRINREARTGTIWIALGERRCSGRGYARRAADALLRVGFGELALRVIDAWAVECNYASLRIIRSLGFKPIGRQRQCHVIDGRPFDRLWFDLLASEHRGSSYA